MRRIGNMRDTIVSFDNLCQAAHRAALGKGGVRGVARFLDWLEPELLHLQRELQDNSYRPGAPLTFVVHDPRVREITAAPFRDRVVHHALIDPLEPWLDLEPSLDHILGRLSNRSETGSSARSCPATTASRPRPWAPHPI